MQAAVILYGASTGSAYLMLILLTTLVVNIGEPAQMEMLELSKYLSADNYCVDRQTESCYQTHSINMISMATGILISAITAYALSIWPKQRNAEDKWTKLSTYKYRFFYILGCLFFIDFSFSVGRPVVHIRPIKIDYYNILGDSWVLLGAQTLFFSSAFLYLFFLARKKKALAYQDPPV